VADVQGPHHAAVAVAQRPAAPRAFGALALGAFQRFQAPRTWMSHGRTEELISLTHLSSDIDHFSFVIDRSCYSLLIIAYISFVILVE